MLKIVLYVIKYTILISNFIKLTGLLLKNVESNLIHILFENVQHKFLRNITFNIDKLIS